LAEKPSDVPRTTEGDGVRRAPRRYNDARARPSGGARGRALRKGARCARGGRLRGLPAGAAHRHGALRALRQLQAAAGEGCRKGARDGVDHRKQPGADGTPLSRLRAARSCGARAPLSCRARARARVAGECQRSRGGTAPEKQRRRRGGAAEGAACGVPTLASSVCRVDAGACARRQGFIRLPISSAKKLRFYDKAGALPAAASAEARRHGPLTRPPRLAARAQS